jgi:hypothetical protein
MYSQFFGHGGKYQVSIPNGSRAGERCTIKLRNEETGEIMTRSAYRTSEKHGYMQDFKISFKGKTRYLSDILDLGRK